MKKLPILSFRAIVTVLMVVCALVVLKALWHYYMDLPWTRNAHVAEDVVTLSPDVSGIVEQVLVKDNSEVKKGQVLFVIDQSHYRIAVAQAKGALAESEGLIAQKQAQVTDLQQKVSRDRTLGDLVSTEDTQSRRAQLQAAKADLQAAESARQTALANLDKANLDLERTVVRSPSDGRVNDRLVRVGSYAHAGQEMLAILDTDTLHIEAYLEETRFSGVRIGQPVDIKLMGESRHLKGRVAGISAGIEDRYRTESSRLLPNVTPQFDWVRLAQRIPVWISLDEVPEGVQLVAGRTATIHIQTDDHNQQEAEDQQKAEGQY